MLVKLFLEATLGDVADVAGLRKLLLALVSKLLAIFDEEDMKRRCAMGGIYRVVVKWRLGKQVELGIVTVGAVVGWLAVAHRSTSVCGGRERVQCSAW
jgi:hypothetical protein